MENESRPNGSKKEMITYILIVILLTFSFNLISGHVSHYSLTSLRFFGFILLLVALLTLFPFSILSQFTLSAVQEDKEIRDKALILLLIVAAVVILFLTSHRVFWMLSVGLFMVGLYAIAKVDVGKYVSPIIAGTFLYIVIFLVYIFNSYVYNGVMSLSVWVTRVIGDVIAVPMQLGPSSSGFWVWLYFAVCMVALLFITEKEPKKLQKFVLFLCGSVVLWVVSIVLYGLVFLRLDIYPLSQVTLLQVALFFMLAGLFIYNIRKVSVSVLKKPTIIGSRKGKQTVVLLLFLSTIFLAAIPYMTQGATGKIVFYERNCAIGSTIPEFPEEGDPLPRDQGISFGTMLWYFTERGYTVEKITDEDTITVRDALQGADVFIAANLNEQFSSDDVEAIQSFVKAGGGLLFLGEHTNMMASAVDFQAGRHYLNDVIADMGITIKIDTAEWTKEHWQTSTVFLPHPVVRGLHPDDIRTGSVGASLEVTGSAEPVMVGRYAFSDDPNPLEPGFLGNRELDQGELLGGIILAAANTYGKGNVLVFGDTSFGFNEALPGTWRLMDNSLNFLTSKWRIPSIVEWAALFLFVVSIVLLFYQGYTTFNASMLYAALILALLIASSIALVLDTSHMRTDAIAWIDVGHSNLLNTRGYKDNSVDGLCKNFMRNKYIPLYLTDASQLKEGSILIVIAPTKGYSSGEVNRITSFVEGGGLLIMSVGAMEKDAAKPLLNAFEMDVGDIPLGPVPWIIETHGRVPEISEEDLDKYWHEPKFMEVYPVGGNEPYQTYASLTYLGQTYNLIIAKQFGKGMVVLIGDSRYLLNENFEYSLDPARLGKPTFAALWVGNIELLRDVITDFEEGLQ